MYRLAVFMTLAGALCVAGSKERVWQPGKLLEMGQGRNISVNDLKNRHDVAPGGTMFGVNTTVNQPSINTAVLYDAYIIDTADCVYLVEQTRVNPSRPANLSL